MPQGAKRTRTGGWSGSARPAACLITSGYCWMACSGTPPRTRVQRQRCCPNSVPPSPASSGRHRTLSIQTWPSEAGFTTRPDRARRRWLIIGCALFAAGAAAIVVAAARSHLGLIPVPVALAGLVLICCARWMPVRTAKGTDLACRLLGFRRYLTKTVAGQTRPAGQVNLLDDYLPYAIVFGCTNEWAEVSAAVAGSDRAPSWYRGSGQYWPGNPASLSRSASYFSPMHRFATTTNNWIASQSASSGGSGFSGFSGGGGGGGGGGSW